MSGFVRTGPSQVSVTIAKGGVGSSEEVRWVASAWKTLVKFSGSELRPAVNWSSFLSHVKFSFESFTICSEMSEPWAG